MIVRRRLMLSVTVVSSVSLGPSLYSPAATLSGSVLADSTGTFIEGAEVGVPGLSLRTLTGATGRFHLNGIPAGSHEIVIRYVGYSPLVDTIAFTEGAAVVREFRLRRVRALEAVTVQASAVIPTFEEHRAVGLGTFITRAELAKQEGRSLSAVLSQVRGVRVRSGMGGRAWLYSGRRAVTSIVPRTRGDEADRSAGALKDVCYAQVYVNQDIVYRGQEGEPLFDLNSVSPSQIEAIEFYSGPATTPMRYSRLNSNCGVLVIHTRRTP